MITVDLNFFNIVFSDLQNIYDDEVNAYLKQDHLISDDHTIIHHFVIHGYYDRTIILNSRPVVLTIIRIKDMDTCITHALIPSFVIPYKQISIPDMINILFHCDTHNDYEYNRYLFQFHQVVSFLNDSWYHLTKHISVPELIPSYCLDITGHRFMQFRIST